MASRTFCRSLGLLKQNLGGLKVDDGLLKKMQKWDCLTPKDVNDLQGKPEAERLNSIMQCLENRGPSKWCLLVCIFLEIGQGEMAKSTWRAVLEHVKNLQTTGKHNEAMDVWEAFVRRMSVALVLDQQPGQESQGKWAKQLKDSQRETALKIWKDIMETVKPTHMSANDWNMWKILVNSVTKMMSSSELKNGYRKSLWEELVGSVLDRLSKGEPKEALLMYEYLLGKAERVAFASEVWKHKWQVMVDFMLQVQDSNQSYFVDDVKEVIVKLLRNLFGSHDLESQVLATHLFMLLGDNIPTLLEKRARRTAKSLWNVLVDLVKGLRKDSKRNHMLTKLYHLLDQLRDKKLAGVPDLEEMRMGLPSESWSMDAHQGSDIDAVGDASSTGPQSDAPLIGVYPVRPQSSGLALVINNVDFDEKEARRDGSEMDELALSPLLRRLGFHVQQETNLSKDGLVRAIAAFADRPEHADADVAVLAVMTHGGNEALQGTDGEMLPFQTVVDCFSNQNAPNLAGKPKWLCLQACRSKSEKMHHESHESGSSDYSDAPTTDLFITFTTLSGRFAIRDPVKGTWYVQALKDVLDLPQAHTLSFFELHMKAQEIMSAIWNKERAEHVKKCVATLNEHDPCFTCRILAIEPKIEVRTLGCTKKLYFGSTTHES